MKNNHKMFILIEGALGLLVLILAIVMLRGNTSRNLDKVSVIVQDSDDNQWDAFKYGLRMAAEDQEIEINGGTNILQIKGGKADMIEADCPDQLCIHQGPIHIQGETIVCLSNRVVVEITGNDKEEQLDGIVQ